MEELKMKEVRKISNPLTTIGVFLSLSEAVAIAALNFSNNEKLQTALVIFSIALPSVVVIWFFLLLTFRHGVLYAPGDFENQEGFLEVLKMTSKTFEVSQKGITSLTDLMITKLQSKDISDEDKQETIQNTCAGLKQYQDMCNNASNNMTSYINSCSFNKK